jgi:SOS-response transcriptional repressor LexA
MVLRIRVPERGVEDAGVLVADEADIRTRFRRDLAELDEANEDWLAELAADLEAKAREMGPLGLMAFLEECASGYLDVSDPEPVSARSPEEALIWYYHRNVRAPVRRYRTHLPLYALEAAAGRWGPEREVEAEPEDWLEAPPNLRRLSDDMFVARVTGRSMEPLIPDGSLCVFRGGAALAGSRSGKRLLIANYNETGDQRFTVKVYQSVKRAVDAERNATVQVVLHPLNPEYPSWELDYEPFDAESSGRIRVVGEFVCVWE